MVHLVGNEIVDVGGLGKLEWGMVLKEAAGITVIQATLPSLQDINLTRTEALSILKNPGSPVVFLLMGQRTTNPSLSWQISCGKMYVSLAWGL